MPKNSKKIMTDMISKFESLEIDKCDVLALSAKLDDAVALTITKWKPPDKIVKICKLQFFGVLDSSLTIRASPWLQSIESHGASLDTKYLRLVQASEPNNDSAEMDFVHFSIAMESGTIDVIAREFVFSVLKKVRRSTVFRDAND